MFHDFTFTKISKFQNTLSSVLDVDQVSDIWLIFADLVVVQCVPLFPVLDDFLASLRSVGVCWDKCIQLATPNQSMRVFISALAQGVMLIFKEFFLS